MFRIQKNLVNPVNPVKKVPPQADKSAKICVLFNLINWRISYVALTNVSPSGLTQPQTPD